MMTFWKTATFGMTLAAAAAACAISACSSSTSPPSSPGDDGGSSGGSTSSGGSCSGDGGKVPTNVVFLSGNPTCAADAGCDLSSNVCCIGTAGGTCTPTATGCKAGYGNFGCIDDTSCSNGQVCCFQADQTAMTIGSSCQTVAAGGKCSPAITMTAGSAQLCQTNSECKEGCCAWQDCTVMGKMLSLTMCGAPPTSSAFSCTPH
ncbi:MAG: hypothetical protein ACRENE_08120 [Polyangiaceae bacterium]